jgi:hypothetical protein
MHRHIGSRSRGTVEQSRKVGGLHILQACLAQPLQSRRRADRISRGGGRLQQQA